MWEGGREGQRACLPAESVLWKSSPWKPYPATLSLSFFKCQLKTRPMCCLLAGHVATLNKMRVLLVRSKRECMLDSQLARCATDWKGEKKVATWRVGTFTEMGEAGRNRFGRKARVQLGHIKFEMAWGLPWSCQVDTAPSSMLPYATTLLLVKSPGIHRARTYGWKGVCRDLTPRPIYIIYSLLT